jgi:hypothetical protein
VRQASIAELKQILRSANNHAERVNQRFHAGFEELNGIGSTDDISDYLEELTPTHIESLAHLSAEKLINDVTFIFDMSAPMGLILERCRERVEKIKSSQSSKEDIFHTWFLYGVLPFIDLSAWASRANIKVDSDVRASIVLPQTASARYTAKDLAKTKSLAKACLDTKGEVLTALKDAAVREISMAIEIARDNTGIQTPDAIAEAWERWFPRTYPIDIYQLRRWDRAAPNTEASAGEIEDIFRNDGLFALNTRDRIRKFKPDPGVQTDALFKLGDVLGF